MARAGEVLIRLTPSAPCHRGLRPALGWQPGLTVLIARMSDGGFRSGVLGADAGPVVEFSSRGIRLAVPTGEADYFRGSVLSYLYDALFESFQWWLENPNDRGRSGCSDPLGASCSRRKFRRLHPELFGLRVSWPTSGASWLRRTAVNSLPAPQRICAGAMVGPQWWWALLRW